jgi:hypothetical protein
MKPMMCGETDRMSSSRPHLPFVFNKDMSLKRWYWAMVVQERLTKAQAARPEIESSSQWIH